MGLNKEQLQALSEIKYIMRHNKLTIKNIEKDLQSWEEDLK